MFERMQAEEKEKGEKITKELEEKQRILDEEKLEKEK